MTGGVAGSHVVVTGGTGFLGAYLVPALVTAGARVSVVAAGAGWREPVRGMLRSDRVRLVAARSWWAGDTTRRVADAVGTVDHLVHLAYRPAAGSAAERARAENELNVLGTLRLLESLGQGVRHVCFASSTKAYGDGTGSLMVESACPRPADPYGAAKVAVEDQLRVLASRGGPTATVVRLSTLYGPMETVPRAIPNFIRAALVGDPATISGPGTERNDYLHVRDAVELIAQTLADPPDRFRLLNAGTGVGCSTADVADRVARLVAAGRPGTSAPLEPVHAPGQPGPDRVSDVHKAEVELGFRASTDFDGALAEEIAWFVARPRLWRPG